MLRQVFRKLLLITLAFGIFFLPGKLQAGTISGYEELISVLAKESSQQEQLLLKQTVMDAEKEALFDILKKEYKMTEVQTKKFKRDAKEGIPTRLFEFDDKYITIGLEKELFLQGTWETIGLILLFEKKSLININYRSKYLLWTGEEGFPEYRGVSKAQLCKDFSHLAKLAICKPRSPQERKKIENIEAELGVMGNQIGKIDAMVSEKADQKHKHSGTDISSGVIKASFIDAAITRDSELQQALKQFSKKIPKQQTRVSNEKELEKRIVQLENRIKKLTALLEGISRSKGEIIFSGVNVRIVNGSGSTEGKLNGLGNLIVGYNEPRGEGHETLHSGSHNVIVGSKHNYSSYGGLVVGAANTISGKYSSVCGGQWNTATGEYSSVSGGHLNAAKGNYSCIRGGLNEMAKEENACGGCQ